MTIGIAGIIGGLGTSIAAKKNKERQEAQMDLSAEAARSEYGKQNQLVDSIFNKQYYQDITNRTEVQNMMRLMEENQEKQAKRDEALAAITGGTAESALAAQESRNKSYADTLADIASNASTLKDTYLQNYQAQKLALANPEERLAMQKANLFGNRADQFAQTSVNLFNTGGQLFAQGLDSWVPSPSDMLSAAGSSGGSLSAAGSSGAGAGAGVPFII
jgi:hypothetical protein